MSTHHILGSCDASDKPIDVQRNPEHIVELGHQQAAGLAGGEEALTVAIGIGDSCLEAIESTPLGQHLHVLQFTVAQLVLQHRGQTRVQAGYGDITTVGEVVRLRGRHRMVQLNRYPAIVLHKAPSTGEQTQQHNRRITHFWVHFWSCFGFWSERLTFNIPIVHNLTHNYLLSI